MKNKILKSLLAVLALAAVAVPVSAAVETSSDTAPAASAAVTNCTTISYGPNYYQGKCLSTSANPPYTTQFQVRGTCYKNVTQNGQTTQVYAAIAGPWRTAGPNATNSVGWCPSGYYTASSLNKYYAFQ